VRMIFENLAVSIWRRANSQSKTAQPHANQSLIAETHANLGCPGMSWEGDRGGTIRSATPPPVGIGFGIGWPLGGPRVAQASPKAHARETQGSN
jgi:hypothetical protein